MDKLDIHKDIYDKLNYFKKVNKIPNILFYGNSGCGKKTILNDFINIIYDNDKTLIKSHIMNINCAHCKGIKFIRDELKFFAKLNINYKNGLFKSIILYNADKLTADAQSALRRCIEIYNYSTRFFMIVENKNNILVPILSRFVEIYIPLPIINNVVTNLKLYHINHIYDFKKEDLNRYLWLKNKLNDLKTLDNTAICTLSTTLYDKGYSGLDLINYIEKYYPEDEHKYYILINISNIKTKIIHEKTLMLIILNLLIRSDFNLENITFM